MRAAPKKPIAPRLGVQVPKRALLLARYVQEGRFTGTTGGTGVPGTYAHVQQLALEAAAPCRQLMHKCLSCAHSNSVISSCYCAR
jgi:hypothetical protein